MNDAEQLAKNRFTILTITRFMDLALVLAGLANVNGQLLPEFTPYLGMFLVIVGAFGFFAVLLGLAAAYVWWKWLRSLFGSGDDEGNDGTT